LVRLKVSKYVLKIDTLDLLTNFVSGPLEIRMRLNHIKIYFILFLLLSCNNQKENYSYNGEDLIQLEKEIKVDSSFYFSNILITEPKSISCKNGELIYKDIYILHNLIEDINFEIKEKPLRLIPFKFNEMGEEIESKYTLKYILVNSDSDLKKYSKKDKVKLKKVNGPFWIINQSDKNIKIDAELSLDSIIKLAKEIEYKLPINCEIDSTIVQYPTTICYLNNEIKKIIETRHLDYTSFDTISKSKTVTHRIIYLINNQYSLVLHPIFESPEIIIDKWNWNKIVIKNDEVIQYKTKDFNNHKGAFLSKKSSRFINAQNYYPIRIERLLNKYNKQSK
jgi:hypothetical protein